MTLLKKAENGWAARMSPRVSVLLGATMVALFLLLFFARYHRPDGERPEISISFSAGEAPLQVATLFWREDCCYAFFPAYADLRNVVFESGDSRVRLIAGSGVLPIGEAVDLTRFLTDDSLRLVVSSRGNERIYPLCIKQSKNLASMFISTESGSTEFIHASKENKEKAKVVCILPDGSVDSMGNVTIKCHGNSTFFSAEKKSYRIKLEKRTSILGMDAAKKWILQSNVYDSAKIRNRVSYYLAERLGLPFAVQAEYVDLYVNKTYMGNYLAQDSVNVAKNRIDIPENSSFLIVAQDEVAGEMGFIDIFGQSFTIKHPENADQASANAIHDYFIEIEKTIMELGEEESLEHLGELIDLDSFAIMYLVDQFTNEADANGRSTYYYYSGEDRLLHAGPAWDFDQSMGNKVIVEKYTEINAFFNGLPEQLWNNRQFRALAKEKLGDRQKLFEELIDCIDISSEIAEQSIKMDTIRWEGIDKGLFDMEDYDYNLNYAKWVFQNRFVLIADAVQHSEDYCNLYIKDGRRERTVWISKGGTISTAALESLREQYECDDFVLSNGKLIWDGFPILGDISVSPVITTSQQKEEAVGMDLLFVIILFAPGLLSLFLSGECRSKSRHDLALIVVEYGIYTFFTLMFTYAVIFKVKGVATIGWGTATYGYDFPLSNDNVALKIMGLQLIGSVIIGLCARLYFKVVRPRFVLN